VFHVARAGVRGPNLEGIEASIVLGDGSVLPAGKTNSLGEVSIPRSLLLEKDASAVLFCGPDVFCGAARIRQENLLAVDGFSIELAPRPQR
jgi:hypothetical protein